LKHACLLNPLRAPFRKDVIMEDEGTRGNDA